MLCLSPRKHRRNTHTGKCVEPPHTPKAPHFPVLSPYSSSRLLTRRLSPALLPFVLPAVVMSISPRKCISLRELQTTKRMPTVCSPSTSHFSWKNRFILFHLFSSLPVPVNRNLPFATGQPRPPPPPAAPARERTAFVSSVSPLSLPLYAGVWPS